MAIRGVYDFVILTFKDPPEVLHRCLLIAHKLYSNLKMQKLGPALLTLLETLVCFIPTFFVGILMGSLL